MLGACSLVLPHGWKRPQEDAAVSEASYYYRPIEREGLQVTPLLCQIQVPAGSRCRPQREYQLSEESWLRSIPEENLNHR